MAYPIIKITGDTSVAVVFGDDISEEMNTRIRAFDKAVADASIDGVSETVPTYCTLMIHYDPEKIRFFELKDKLLRLLELSGDVVNMANKVMEIPVLYGGEYGPDLGFVAANASLSEQEVISIHSGKEYLVYMLGFTPGFSYMGGMDERIATPRLSTPRVVIPAGSVGIAGKQTGIYPIDSPGGWQLIGRTPVKLYDSKRETPILLDAGLRVKFIPINKEEYKRIAEMVEKGTYVCRTYIREDA